MGGRLADILERLTTGIDGLDRVLRGGLVQGGAYIVQGRPGAGKTILANQTCFHHARQGGCVLYVTLLAESHTHLFRHLSTLEFFDRGLIPDQVYYINANGTLADSGLPGFVDLLRGEMKRRRATLLVVDGLLTIRETAGSHIDLKECLQAVQGHAEFAGCTVLMLTSADLDEVSPEHTMADGIIELAEDLAGVRAIRRLTVSKHRGSEKLGGLHQFEISARGMSVHPRLEAVYATPSIEDTVLTERTSTGIPALDFILGGGVARASTTLVLGASGTGKTTLGLNFLGQASPEEPALHFGFYETPPRLRAKAQLLGIDLDGMVASGALDILWQPATENLLDAVGHRLLDAVERRGVRRLFIDGFGGFHKASTNPARFLNFATALVNELRARGVTTVATWEVPRLFGGSVEAPMPEISSIVENLLLLRFAEVGARVHRLLAILKMRDSAYDPQIREFRITGHGIELAPTAESAEALLAGSARVQTPPADQPH
ncbi:serine/threonine protein kinase [Azospirillum sp. RWY-5-1]|uniref:non-specific serine/threonine protein kinase n=1 Tax=Azospirillum oleiclasticum TaxID=2735135 RepID=A0ABX2TBJ5_9PROT|nr:ATPase domain-containing protein [Azospirillum oleiclasticum]NYZ14065.1 serine/threonine protein kinase [Azospirillum oleiclasticum]NYZ21549.1 serine/threonine protein kinase [Azospirillum oleiclasticum]